MSTRMLRGFHLLSEVPSCTDRAATPPSRLGAQTAAVAATCVDSQLMFVEKETQSVANRRGEEARE